MAVPAIETGRKVEADMASSYLSKPGEKFGPCKKSCEHRDCVQTREMAATECRICKKPIGYDRSFYQENDWKVLVHALCLELEIDEEWKVKDAIQKGRAE